MARYKAKVTFCDGVIGTIYRGNICEIPDRLATTFLGLGYIEPYMQTPNIVKPAPLADIRERVAAVQKPEHLPEFEQRLQKIVEPETKPKRKYIRKAVSRRRK